jgi:hypothetical protein
MFSQPLKMKTDSEANPTKVRKSLAGALKSAKDMVKRVWEPKTDKLSDEDWSLADSIVMRYINDEEQHITYSWFYPLIFKLKIPKGAPFSSTDEIGQKTISSIEATILYNGRWFMALVDRNQFSTVEELSASGPDIRDVLKGTLETTKAFVPVLVPPCIIPKSFNVELYTKGEKNKKRFPKYIETYKYEDSPKFVVSYQTESVDVTDEDIIEIMKDIYFDIGNSLDSFYLLAEQSDHIQYEHEDVLELYKKACSGLQEYIKIPFWNIVKKCLVANALSKNVSNIQVQLVDNRLSQVHILNDAEEINAFEDKKDILRNMKEYLKNCIVKDFNLGTVEYEGLMTNLSHMERLASQHNTILLGIVAIIAALIGVVIGAWIG